MAKKTKSKIKTKTKNLVANAKLKNASESKTDSNPISSNLEVDSKLNNLNIDSKPISNESVDLKKSSFFKDNFKLIFVVLIALIVGVFIIAPLFSNPYKFVFEVNGVNYKSNEYVPSEFFKRLADSETIVVSPKILGEVTSQPVVNTVNGWLVAGIGNGKNMIQLFRIVDNQGNLTSCYSNDGNVLSSRVLSSSDCLDYMNKPYDFVFIEIGNNEVILEGNKMTIFSKVENLESLNYNIVSQIFPNLNDLYARSNQIIYGAT
jgi:hypothetical protein